MNEPDNHTVLIDRDGDTWVRFDEWPGEYGTWRHISTGSVWDEWARGKVGQARSWEQILDHEPLKKAPRDREVSALWRVREAQR